MWVFEQHEVLQVLASVEAEVGVLVGAEEVADLLMEQPLVVKADFELAHLVLESLQNVT